MVEVDVLVVVVVIVVLVRVCWKCRMSCMSRKSSVQFVSVKTWRMKKSSCTVYAVLRMCASLVAPVYLSPPELGQQSIATWYDRCFLAKSE